jgi:hypothetical protein
MEEQYGVDIEAARQRHVEKMKDKGYLSPEELEG